MTPHPSTDALLGMLPQYLDLVFAPFTLPKSRILVMMRTAEGATHPTMTVARAEYERNLDDCTLFSDVRVETSDGTALDVSTVEAHRIVFGDMDACLTFAGPEALSFGAKTPCRVRYTVDGVITTREVDSDTSVILPGLPGQDVTLATAAAHSTALAETRAVWSEWMHRCPRVRDDLQSMTALCWWVLGANIVELPGQAGARAVVPSKIGYVGLWQWDAYFIAVGLRHGDPELAREQLQLAFAFISDEGQLPDVVHDQGILSSSTDLPPVDLANLRRMGSAVADPDAPVPLTKPPLAAWALEKVLDVEDAPEFASAAWEVVSRSQDWWFSRSDSDSDGMPEYGHPYSSGLDDSPIFDGPLPVATPDLGAYLVVQDRLLARQAALSGDLPQAQRCNLRAERTLEKLCSLWSTSRSRFCISFEGELLESYTAVSLIPLLTGELPAHMSASMVESLSDESQFGTPWGVPTVAHSDPDFSPERMWRGPVWININSLIIEGLDKSGHHVEAERLAEQTVQLVIAGGGPNEYYNPYTGRKAATSTTSFGWSAAWFIDLAVRLSGPHKRIY